MRCYNHSAKDLKFMNNRFIFLSALVSGCALLLSACVSEENAVDETAPNVQFVISAPFNSSTSRAANDGAYVAEASSDELINSYVVAVTVQGSSDIVGYVAVDGLDGVEESVVDLELRPGNYTVYGFANITPTELATLGIKEGGSIPTDLGSLRTCISSSAFSGTNLVHTSQLGTAAFPAIPMTSVAGMDVTVTERVNQTFGIEVRRMLAKLQFDFRNPTAKDIELQSIAISNMTQNIATPSGTDPILLMNYEEGRSTIDLPTDVVYKKLSHSYGTSPVQLTKGFTGTVSDGTAPQHSEVFYVLESAADAEANAFQLDFELDEVPSPGLPDKMRYALTDPNTLTLIHRNDWIVIPVTLGDWVMELQAMSYPPIGGYPDAKVTYDPDRANLFSVTFAAPGVVGFYPMIHKYYEPSDFFYLNDPTRIVSGSSTVSVEDPSGIFEGSGAVDDPKVEWGSAGELTGVLTGTPGKATITINTKIIVKPASGSNPAVEQPFKAYIKVEKK